MEAIKHSKIIVILLILYIGIAILVVTLDQSMKGKNKDSDEPETEEVSEIEKFISDVAEINGSVITYYQENGLTTDICIPFTSILGDEASGSAYVSEEGTSVKMWYSDGTYAINNIETNSSDIDEDSIENEYSTPYYNNCGLDY